MTRLAVAAAVVAATLIVPATARAIGGPYVVTGGTAAERRSVTAALDASSFDWNAVPAKIAVHVVRGADSFSTRGEIWLDADLLDAGKFAWGVVQHEYAHQVDYFRFDDAIRARFLQLLGASEWCYGATLEHPHAAYGCERFASTLAWAYWQSPSNCMKPAALGAESGALAPAAFRALLQSLLGPGAGPGAAGAAGAAGARRYTMSVRGRAASASAAARP